MNDPSKYVPKHAAPIPVLMTVCEAKVDLSTRIMFPLSSDPYQTYSEVKHESSVSTAFVLFGKEAARATWVRSDRSTRTKAQLLTRSPEALETKMLVPSHLQLCPIFRL